MLTLLTSWSPCEIGREGVILQVRKKSRSEVTRSYISIEHSIFKNGLVWLRPDSKREKIPAENLKKSEENITIAKMILGYSN